MLTMIISKGGFTKSVRKRWIANLESTPSHTCSLRQLTLTQGVRKIANFVDAHTQGCLAETFYAVVATVLKTQGARFFLRREPMATPSQIHDESRICQSCSSRSIRNTERLLSECVPSCASQLAVIRKYTLVVKLALNTRVRLSECSPTQ